jgi:hypothetical protein
LDSRQRPIGRLSLSQDAARRFQGFGTPPDAGYLRDDERLVTDRSTDSECGAARVESPVRVFFVSADCTVYDHKPARIVDRVELR